MAGLSGAGVIEAPRALPVDSLALIVSIRPKQKD